MNYQTLIKLPYVINLIYSLINQPHTTSSSPVSPRHMMEIVSVNELYYIKDKKGNLYIIDEELGKNTGSIPQGSLIIQILNTCKHFEKYKEYPINSYVYVRKMRRGEIDYELLKALHSQYVINKSYFTDLSSSK